MKARIVESVVVGAMLWASVGCGGDGDAGSNASCEPGRQVSCPCAAGDGVQTCSPDGEGWGECACGVGGGAGGASVGGLGAGGGGASVEFVDITINGKAFCPLGNWQSEPALLTSSEHIALRAQCSTSTDQVVSTAFQWGPNLSPGEPLPCASALAFAGKDVLGCQQGWSAEPSGEGVISGAAPGPFVFSGSCLCTDGLEGMVLEVEFKMGYAP